MPAGGQPMDDTQFRAWKSQLVPLLYDWFSNHNLTWPSQACRWGPMLQEHTFKNKHRIYISEQTSPDTDEPSSDPPKLLLVDADICKPRVASTEVVATWGELSRCPYIKEVKTIVHPGEVNKIRELPQHLEVLVTHTDAPELYVWNTATQPNMTRDKETKRWGSSVADMKLVGHERDALFPLATCNVAPAVASGGEDKLVVLWDLADELDGALAKKDGAGERTTTALQCRRKLVGHKKTVEDLVFQPGSKDRLVSVGDDAQVLFWDCASGSSPIASVEKAHGSCDVHTVDWSGLQDWLIVTGAADGSLKVWDRRRLPASGGVAGGALHVFNYHTDAIMRVEWHPSEQGVLASGGEDHLVVVWSLARAGAAAADAAGSSKAAGGSKAGSSKEGPPEVLFKHVGHRAGKVVDFQWCPESPWTMMSVSDDTHVDTDGASKGGGTLQIWRISDMLYLPEEAVVAELEAHREWILTGREAAKPKPKADAAGAAAAAVKAEDKGAAPKGEGGKKGEKAAAAAAAKAAAAAGGGDAMEVEGGADPMEVEEPAKK